MSWAVGAPDTNYTIHWPVLFGDLGKFVPAKEYARLCGSVALLRRVLARTQNELAERKYEDKERWWDRECLGHSKNEAYDALLDAWEAWMLIRGEQAVQGSGTLGKNSTKLTEALFRIQDALIRMEIDE